MSGYRDTSSYDPYGSPRYGKPLRPFNWVQWTGVALIWVGVAGYLAWVAGRFGWIDIGFDNPTPVTVFCLFGIALINSRREVVHDPAPELAAARKRWLIITIAVVAVILGAATAIAFSTGA